MFGLIGAITLLEVGSDENSIQCTGTKGEEQRFVWGVHESDVESRGVWRLLKGGCW